MYLKKCKFLVSGIAVLSMFLLAPNTAQANIYLKDIGLNIVREAGFVDLYPDKNSLSEFFGIEKRSDLQRVNNVRIAFLQDSKIKNIINNNQGYYIFTVLLQGDVIVYNNIKKSYPSGLHYQIINLMDIPDEIKNFPQNNTDTQSQLLDKYKKYYEINPNTFEIQYNKPSKEEIEKFTKNEKEEYKKIKKIQHYIDNKKYFCALEIDKDFLPIYIYMYNNALKDKFIGNAIFALEKLREINDKENIFNDNIINYHLGLLYYACGAIEKSMAYLQPYIPYSAKTNNQFLSWLLATYNRDIRNYETAIFYADQIKDSSIYKPGTYYFKYECYKKLNNKPKVKECLEKLVQIAPTVDYFNELAAYYPTEKGKQALYKKARNALYDKTFNDKIIKYEQAKITNAAKVFSGYYEKPDWNNYMAYFSRTYNMGKVYDYQDLFYDSTNLCIAKYKGQNLKNCFDGVKKKYDKLTDDANKQYYSKLEYDRQKSLSDDVISSQRHMIDELKKEIDSLKSR